MDEKTLEKIFDPFFTTNPLQEGTGLGMYIVHNLIEKIGGRIQVESKLGEGSKFTVILDIS
jgi:signal transduction histidine kinase